MLSLYRSKKDGGNIGIIVEKKLINGQEIMLECVIITFKSYSNNFIEEDW